MVEAELVEDRGVEVMERNGVGDGFHAVFVSFADGDAGLDSVALAAFAQWGSPNSPPQMTSVSSGTFAFVNL